MLWVSAYSTSSLPLSVLPISFFLLPSLSSLTLSLPLPPSSNPPSLSLPPPFPSLSLPLPLLLSPSLHHLSSTDGANMRQRR